MPNGGSDCCGTCGFNAKNKGEAGYNPRVKNPEPHFCQIRNLSIQNAFYTYCANHPRRNSTRIDLPIGPVFTGDSAGYREFWMPSPDSEEIRIKLLELLREIKEEPVLEYPIGIHLETVVIWQLAEFYENRAIDDLNRISTFNPNITDRFQRSRKDVVEVAKRALEKISQRDK